MEKSILDIGCGTGEFLSVCKEKGWKTKGIEPNDNARAQGIKNYSLDIEGEEALKDLGSQFSVISMWHVLEHVHQLNDRVKQIYSLLQSGERLLSLSLIILLMTRTGIKNTGQLMMFQDIFIISLPRLSRKYLLRKE